MPSLHRAVAPAGAPPGLAYGLHTVLPLTLTYEPFGQELAGLGLVGGLDVGAGAAVVGGEVGTDARVGVGDAGTGAVALGDCVRLVVTEWSVARVARAAALPKMASARTAPPMRAALRRFFWRLRTPRVDRRAVALLAFVEPTSIGSTVGGLKRSVPEMPPSATWSVQAEPSQYRLSCRPVGSSAHCGSGRPPSLILRLPQHPQDRGYAGASLACTPLSATCCVHSVPFQ